MTTRHTSQRLAASLAALRRANELRRRANARIAAETRREMPAFLLDDALAHALERGRARLQASHGYVGHAIGHKRRDGIVLPELSITVFVRTKLSKRRLAKAARPAAPASLAAPNGRRIITDVVELALTERQTIAYPGGYVGSQVAPDPGTLTCFARNGAGQLLGLTAGHVAYRAGAYVLPYTSGDVIGTRDQSLTTPADTASIVIQSATTQQLPVGGTMSGWRAVTQYDVGTTVQLFGAESGQWRSGKLIYLAPWLANWQLANVLMYSAPSEGGDSGGPVIDIDGYLIGQHVGRGTHDGNSVAIANSMVQVASALSVNPEF